MSSVTRLHLLSRSMLNVSCQKQKHCSFPLTLTDSSMEFVGQPRPSEACNLLAVPGLSCLDVDEDEGEVVIGIRPKSSPLPRRKSSVTDEDSEPEPPPCGSRRVSFADAKGFSLVQVKEFDTWDVPKLPGYDTPDGKDKDAEEYYLSSFTFFRPLSSEELFNKVLEQKVELETIELLPGTTIVKGVIRVLNISYSKAVYIRTTLDEWSTHFDLLAEYVPGSSDGVMDCFSFKLTLVPPFGDQGARVDFCLRYETPVGTFWSNNNNRNYVLFCHHRMKEEKENPLKENVNKKSCLKTVSPNISPVENKSSKQESSEENISTDEPNMEVEVHQMKAESPSRTSEEKKQELLMENKQNSSRRRHRKAAQLARVRDYFAQRNGGANDSDRDESHPEIKQATQEETQGEKRADMHSYSTGNSKSECTQLVFEALETSSELRHNVAYDHPTSKDVEKSDPATLARVESATDIPDKQSAESASGKQQNISELDEDFWLTDTNVLKNWEMMVEEEENAILANEEQSELINENAKEAEALEKDATERKTEEVEKMDNTVAVEKKEWTKVQDEEGVKVEEKMEMNHGGEAGVEQEHHRELQEEKEEEHISNRGEENTVIETGEAEIVEADSENKGNEVDYFQERSDITQSKVVDGLSALVSNGLEVEKEYTKEEQYENIMKGFPSNEDVTQDRSKTNKHPALEGDMNVSTDEPESDQTCQDSASAESDSDDEVELYMHCLRAVGASTPAHKDRIKDAGLTVSKRPSISRGKLPSTLMPSIRESLDEEQHVSINEESHDDMKTAASTAPSVSSGQEELAFTEMMLTY
ncbi:protein phosphatase 1 regulatory subunit 3A-like [Melanotaenia boesemani]|uniref:protein phosphatase 1 regulatory subunit 3A-like n=1 Tax=Melanotaenia boesemani TaxID=1250792 RepID=UPI001C0568F2|nr:protein phosphatase 1 regulatory subunit 3A-like [Melanotaenia boesemani]